MTGAPHWERSGVWGFSPPYGAYRGCYTSYEQAQFASLASGLLGGWTFSGAGGGFGSKPHPAEEELRQELRRLARPPAAPGGSRD